MNLEEIKRRVEAYENRHSGKLGAINNGHIRETIATMTNDGYYPEYSELASNARRDIPALIAEVERLQSELENAITLPYKIGDTVWAIMPGLCDDDNCQDCAICAAKKYMDEIDISSITFVINGFIDATDCYPTREAAEAATAE